MQSVPRHIRKSALMPGTANYCNGDGTDWTGFCRLITLDHERYVWIQPQTHGGSMRKNRAAGTFAIVIIALLFQTGGVAAADTSCGTSEYELMSLLIREHYGSDFTLILIDRDVESWCLREPLGFLVKQWPDLKGETIDSLIAINNGAPHRFEERFSLPVEYRLMSDDEYFKVLRCDANSSGARTLEAGADVGAAGMEAAAANRGAAGRAAVEPDWDNFDEVFPDALGYLTFSRVAFDAECSQALVIFSNAYRCSGVRTRPQTRTIAFFGRGDGAWELVGVSRGIQAME